MLVGGASRLDINQGMLGDCWLLAALASLTQEKELMAKVLCLDKNDEFGSRGYCGALQFSIWQDGYFYFFQRILSKSSSIYKFHLPTPSLC